MEFGDRSFFFFFSLPSQLTLGPKSNVQLLFLSPSMSLLAARRLEAKLHFPSHPIHQNQGYR